MNQQESISVEAQLSAAQEKLRQLEDELESSRRQITRILDLFQEHQQQIHRHESTLNRLEHTLLQLVTGRTWRTLRAAGELLKRLSPSRSTGNGTAGITAGSSYLICEEPDAKDKRPRSGPIRVKGWCLAEGGVDGIQVLVPGLPTIETQPSVARPDIKKAFPNLDNTGRAGFAVEFDSLQLKNGQYPVTARLLSQGTVVQEIKTFVTINHERGFVPGYERWIREFEEPDEKLIELKLQTISMRPRFSILMPVFNTDPSELSAAIDSVLSQSYGSWELCIADDSSSSGHPKEILERYARQDSRIHVTFRKDRGGISAACNSAWEMATGDYVLFLDHDDTLSINALAWICETLDRVPDADLIYSDEDKIDRQGKRYEPFFKPDWSPDLLLSENYICHVLVLRSDLARGAGPLHSDCDGSQDYDLILKATVRAKKIEHIPRVLYHWRAGVASTAATLDNKSYALEAARRALENYCERTGQAARVEPAGIPGRWRARYPIPDDARVSIIIASGGKADVLRANLDELFERTKYRNYEVVIIDNSKTNAIETVLRRYQVGKRSLRYIDWRNKPFNYSAINNVAARQCDSPILLFLNDDTSVISPDWLEAMVELICRPEVGAVGAKLLYPNGHIQHAGVVMGIFDNCGHAFKGLDGNVSHYFDFSDVIRNVTAVTGACLMTKSKVFWEMGGFDETDFAVAFNDIDLCLKIGQAGYRVLYTPYAVLYHHEAFSKTSKDLVPHPDEVARMRAKWNHIIAADPYYSPNLTRQDEDYSLRTRD